MGKKVFIIKIFKSSGGSSAAVEGQCRPQFSVRVAPSRNTIYRILKQFEDTDSVRDKREECKRSASIRGEEVVGAAQKAITTGPR
jgi:hypothetical protein